MEKLLIQICPILFLSTLAQLFAILNQKKLKASKIGVWRIKNIDLKALLYKTSNINNEMSDTYRKNLEVFIKKYSLDDLAKSFFILNLWLPNIASQIKFQYLYLLLEAIHDQLPTENHIKSYNDFCVFCKELFKLIPSFPTIEDYIPETDWNEINYYFDKKFYKIFYGGDLLNPYDFYYSYEIVHSPFDQYYLDKIKRSPSTELQFCLGLQDYILSNLKQVKCSTLEDVRPGHLELPSEVFWKDAISFLDTYNLDDFSLDMLGLYIKDLVETCKFPDINTFIENAHRGRNCCYFFIRKGQKIYPVMPRKWLTVIYDKWGFIFRDNFLEITKRFDKSKPNVLIGIKIGHFISDRMDNDYVFTLVAPLNADMKPPHDLIYTAIYADDRLYLIYTTPPVFNRDDPSKHLEEVALKLKESAELVKKVPVRLGLFAKNKTIELRPKKAKRLEPVFIIALPSVISDTEGSIRIPDGIEAEIMTLDQLTGIFDEVKNFGELNDYIDYLNEEREKARIPGLNSYLDKFGSFKDSHGVLVSGALEPNMIILDFGWGSNYRYESLKKFWASYPEVNLFGHPRSWTIPEDRKTATGMILNSKNFFGYVYVQKLTETTFCINAPVHLMDIEEGVIADTLMHMLFDAIDIYQALLNKLEISKSRSKVQFFFCSSSIAAKDSHLSHIKHLAQNEKLWVIDSARIHPKDFGIRIVYCSERVVEALQDVKDRFLQVSLLIDAIKELVNVYPEPKIDEIVAELEKEKTDKPRFGMFNIEKRASFPQYVRTLKPDEREYKLADKEIAKIAHELGIEPGTYSAEDAKEKLNKMRAKIVKILDQKIKQYDLRNCLPVLFEKSNALINDIWQTESQFKATMGHDLDFDVSDSFSEKKKEFLHWYRVYRYIIEKFVQHQTFGTKELREDQLKEILALADRLTNLYVSSDLINYELYPVIVNINRDYIVYTKYETQDISAMEKEYGIEQAKLNLGIIGNKNDTVDSSLPVEDYLNELDAPFKKDLGFGLRNLINVQQVLALWADHFKVSEATYYDATIDQIGLTCKGEIKGYDELETEKILDFLTLKPDELLVIKGDTTIPSDLPIWEHNKRLARFDIRPLIKIKNNFYWAPYSIERTSQIWMGILKNHRLPSDIEAPTIKSVLSKGHQNLENNLAAKTKEIVSRFSSEVKTGLYPHKYDSSISDIGDYDVIAYLKNNNILLNIESKIIDPPHSNKDSGRTQRKIFGTKKTDGRFEKGYLQHVEERAAYLNANGQKLMANLGWTTPETSPKVVSIFVTKMGFWWTKHPPIQTNVKFVEIRLLEDFIKKLA